MKYWNRDVIPLSECQHRHLYRLYSRNLSCGVYNQETKGFVGIREKFGLRFLDIESHYDTGSPFGTANPIEDLGPIDEDVALDVGFYYTRGDDHKEWERNDELFEALKDVSEKCQEQNRVDYKKVIADDRDTAEHRREANETYRMPDGA